MTWNDIQEPLVPWGKTVQKVFSKLKLPPINGSTIYVATDYSGSHKESGYEVLSLVYCDLDHSREWLLIQRGFREQFLPDGRRMSFKGLNDKYKAASLIPFLAGANQIHGVCVSLIINKKITSFVGGKKAFHQFTSRPSLKGGWSPDLVERMFRISHFVSLLIAGLAKPNQNIYWLSDEDPIFDTLARHEDVANVLSNFTSHYVHHELGELGIATTKIDEDRIEEDLVAIPDLVAGALSEMAATLSVKLSGGIPHNLGVPFEGIFSRKTEEILSWIWSGKVDPLVRVVLVAELHGQEYSFSRLRMENSYL